jgi:glycosyltransferase involved in cell wall biosynthesis
MLIGIDASRAIKQNKTGVEWYAYYVIENLIKIDSQNQYILYCAAKPNEWLKKLGERKNIKIKRLRWPFKFFWTQGRLSLEMLFNAPDVLFIPASAMPIIHPQNTVAVIHDVGFISYPEAYSKWQKFYLNWSTRFAVRHARKIITISEFSKQEIIKYFQADEKKISVTLLGYDAEKFKIIENREEINAVLIKFNIKRPYILSVGRLECKKNTDGLIKAFALLKRRDAIYRVSTNAIKLVLAGSPGFGFAEIKKLIKENNLQDDIIILNYVSDNDLLYLYNGAQAFVFPSRYEGFGLPILEAFASGTPVVCANTTSLPEVADNAALYFNPNDIDAMVKAMREVLTNENLRQNLINKGRERAARFSREKCAEQTFKHLT